MRALYIASNPRGAEDLNLERQITELQRRLVTSPGDQVIFEFLPALKVEDLPEQLRVRKPDVLHLAAHGETEALSMAREDGSSVKMTAEMLLAFLPLSGAPQLIYLDACDSRDLAKAIVSSGRIEMAIGTTAPLTNGAARAGAVAFYEALLSGYSMDSAFGACHSMLKAMMGRKCAELCAAAGVDAKSRVLHPVPEIVADFASVNGQRGFYKVKLGIAGCPPSTIQVVFITDEQDFADSEDEDLETAMCAVVRGSPENGTIWMEEPWDVNGDFHVVAVGLKAGGGYFALEGSLCKAIENQYHALPANKHKRDAEAVVRALR